VSEPPPLVRAAWLCAAFALGAAAVAAQGPGGRPLLLDNQHYFFVAERAASGVPPHVSHFDPKHALGPLLEAGAIRLGRRIGVDDALAARAASALAVASASALVWALAARVGGRALAGHLAALALLGAGDFLAMAAMGSQPKVYLVPFLAATALAVAARRALLAGGLGSLAFLCWQPAALALAAALPPFALGPARRRALAALALGALSPLAVYELGFALEGALAVQLEQAFRFPLRYMAPESLDLRGNALAFFRLLAGPSLRSVLPLVFGAVLAGCWAWLARRPARRWRTLAARPGLLHLVLAGTLVLAFSLYEYQTYVDGFLALPYAAALAGLAGAAAVERLARGRAGWRRVLSAAALLAFAAPAVSRPERARLGFDLDDQRELDRAVGGLLAAGSVWAVGCTHLLALNHADNHVPYGFFFRGMDAYLAERHPAGDLWLREGRPPDVILIARAFPPAARARLEEEYAPSTPVAFRLQGVELWRRRTGGAPDHSR
jgi:hypothetical protein